MLRAKVVHKGLLTFERSRANIASVEGATPVFTEFMFGPEFSGRKHSQVVSTVLESAKIGLQICKYM